MANQVKVAKTIYSLQSFNNVVDTNFNQLISTTPANETPVTPDLTVDQFFNEYDILFYEIPLSGSDNSHLGLATRSLDYLGLSLEDLQSEISELREENVNLKNQLLLASQIDIGTQV